MFGDGNCTNFSGYYLASSMIDEVLDYDLDAMQSAGMLDNQMSALSLPYGVKVTCYELPGFQGQEVTYYGPFPSDSHLTNHCFNVYQLEPSFNKLLSSLKVTQVSQLGQAKGFWK